MNDINECLTVAVNNNNLGAVIELLENDVSMHINDNVALSNIMNEALDIVTKLLERGANVHANIDHALRFSAKNGYLDIVTKLLEYGADVHAGENTGTLSALEQSVQHNHLDITIELLKRGANVRADDDYVLWLGVRFNRSEVVTILLENGASVYGRNKQILTHIQRHFDERTANAVLPYCEVSDYKYFPEAYIRAKIIPTKNPNTAVSAPVSKKSSNNGNGQRIWL